MFDVKILPSGDSAVLIQLGSVISPQVNAAVHALDAGIKSANINGIVETVPAFASLLVLYDPVVIGYEEISGTLRAICENPTSVSERKSFLYTIPVCYGDEFGEDLEDVAAHAGMSADEVVRCHSERTYLIYMLGFLPGFPYLGGLDPAIVCPRLASPRQKIEAGSVGIGGEQTGVYPLASPGGWRLIGRTPVKLYDPNRAEPIFYSPGDSVKFSPIDRREYDRIAAEAEKGNYIPEKEAVL